MSKNYMADVAKMLGVEVGEEFDVATFQDLNPYKITGDGLVDRFGTSCPTELVLLLRGKFDIVKKPRKPQEKETYYYILLSGGVTHTTFAAGNILDVLRVRLGNCFTTQEEANANADKWAEYIKREPDFSWRKDKDERSNTNVEG